jgi:stage II sporulation protein D
VGTKRPSAGYGPVVRVLIAERTGASEVVCTGGFRVESEGGVVLMRSDDPATIRITCSRRSLQLHFEPRGTAAVAEGNIYITPLKSADLSFGGIAYPGRFSIRVADGGAVQLINVLPLETYLEGVLPHEIGNPGPEAFAALQAQAIAARTYAIQKTKQRKDESYDVSSDVGDQVYRGNERVYQLTASAVRETRGMVLDFEGELARTYYSATCGGHTSDIRRVWPRREPARYLRGTRDRSPRDREAFCEWTKKFRWRRSFSGKQLGVMLRNTIPAELGIPRERVGSLVDLRILERNPSGRVRRLEIVTTRGTFTVEGDRIRWALMGDWRRGVILPSTMFSLHKRMQNGKLAFVSITGGGNGHGVGMCQNGAIGMARKGYTYRMILSHYYPGTSLVKRY